MFVDVCILLAIFLSVLINEKRSLDIRRWKN